MKYLKRQINDEMTTYEAVEPDKYEPNDAVNSHLYFRTGYKPQSDFIQELPPERYYKENEQMELFRHHVNPASNEVRTVGGTERGRTHFPLLLAVANNDSLRNFGIPLTPSDNLSRHSLKIAQNLQDRGLISPEVELPMGPTNDITFDSTPEWHYLYEDQNEIPAKEISEGRSSLKEMLRKRKNLSNQFDVVSPPIKEKHTQLELDL